jgi:hypothetical protein
MLQVQTLRLYQLVHALCQLAHALLPEKILDREDRAVRSAGVEERDLLGG